ncbi:RHS repeat-associated core domain-containing protein [Xenorhabdus sp. DI]|nr:RHS repeat-associated core domain-containing protein [Xenorhabdus sp. 3]MBD2789390.1 RHS repeat-associated core domain-containing protein [Xenorhabdus sp. DI]
MVKRTRWTGHDQLSLTTRRRQSQVSGKLWHEVDAQQRTARYDYDHLGRLVTQVSNAQTGYSQQVQYAYAIEEAGVATTTKTDVWGSQARVRFDGLGQPYQQERLEKGREDQGWQLLSDTERDSWGRVVSQSHYDWLPVGNASDNASVVPVAVRQRFEYDDWGKVHRVIRDTGETLQHDYDPVTRTAQITRQAGGLPFSHCTVVYDQRHQPVTTTLYDSQGKQYSQQHNHYDGLGRLRATVDALGQKTEYTYDLLGRVSRIRHSDGTVIQKSYAPFSTGNLVTQIQAGEIILGRREFDSLHRVVSTTRGGRTCHARYLQDSPLPSQITDPLGNIVTHRYEPLLGNALTQTDAAEIQQRFAYDPKTGAMTRARAVQQAARDLHYTAAGRLQQETFRFEDRGAGAARTAGYSYSPGGQLTGYQDVAGNRRQVRFDQYGRPVAACDPAIDIALAYDAASRVKSWQVHDKQHDRQLTTVVDFDDFGREVRRQIQTAGDTLTLEQRYTVNGQVASRTTRSQQAGLLRQETYEYDPARHWLTAYDCSGAEQPKDAYGVSIARQRFTYDILGNMLTCTTTLADGSCDTAAFAYSVSDPCQLQAVTHTHPHYPATITLAYDGAGRLIRDEAGRRLTYDALGRLAAVHQGEAAGTYGYDAADRLVLQKMVTDHTHELYYQGATRVAEILREQGTVTRLLQAHGSPAATVTGAETHLLGTDNHGSVLVNQQGDGTETRYRYSPYGQQAPAEQAATIPAYNGERLDPVAGGYLLGNGYRAYNPVLMRFNAPDSESPFGAGRLNAYAYCLGDPINRIDPTGHFSWGSIFGIVLGAVGLLVLELLSGFMLT